MKYAEYQKLAAVTLAIMVDEKKDMIHMSTGLFTEFGEILDVLKKKFAYGKQVDVVNLKEECGDALWYIAGTLTIMSEDMSMADEKEFEIHTFEDEFQMAQTIMGVLASASLYDMNNILIDIANHYGFTMEDVMETNIAKLKARYGDKFNAEGALNRDLNAERKILEGEFVQTSGRVLRSVGDNTKLN